MDPANHNTLEQDFESSEYNSSLETPSLPQAQPLASASDRRGHLSVFRYNKLAFSVTIVALIVIGAVAAGTFALDALHRGNQSGAALNSSQPSGNFKVGSISLQNVKTTQQLEVGETDHLLVNGQLKVANTVVLSPTSVPTTPVVGQIYYDKTANAPYYFNGTAFVSLSPAAVPQHVTTLGGAAGVIALGGGLSINGDQLSVSSNLLQAVANAGGVNTPRVTSLQGLTGAVTLTAGSGIGISGTTITNTGITSLNAGAGIGVSGNTITNNGVTALTSSDSSVLITANGGGSYDLKVVQGGPGSTAVILNPALAQTDNTALSSVHINKTGSGDFLELASNGTDTFVVDKTGQITTGTIDYSQVQGAPATTVTSIAGVSGALSLGAGLGIAGSTLSNSGVVSITGTANQVIASAASGNLTLSLPQDIADTSTPTFGGETLNGALDVTVGGASIAGGLTVSTAGATIAGGLTVSSGGATVTGSVTLGSLGAGLVQSDGSGLLSSGAANRNSATLFVNALDVGNGGTGAATFTTNGIIYGNAAGALQATGAAANSILATNGTDVPGLTQTLPTAVQDNITATGTLGAGSIGSGFGVISTASNIVTSAVLQGGTLSVASGDFTVDGSGNVTTTGIAAVQGAGGLTLGVAGTVAGSLVFASAGGNNHVTTLQGLAPSGQDQTITIPASTASTDTVCLLTLANCVGTGGGVTVSGGTLNYVPKFTNAGGTVVGNSLLFDNGTTVGVGTNTPSASYLLDVNGNVNTGGSLSITGSGSFTTGSGSVTLGSLGAGLVQSSGSGLLSSGAADRNSSSLFANDLTVANGGTGVGTFTANGLLYGNGTGVLQVTAAAANSILATNGSSLPGLTQTLPTAVQGNITATGALASGSIASGFGTIATGSSISTTAALQGGTLSIAGGDFTVDGSGNVVTTGTAAVEAAGGLTLGTSGVAGSLVFDNPSNAHTVTLQGLAAVGQNEVITVPASTATTDTVCLLTLANCVGTGGGVTSSSGAQNYITKFTNAGGTVIGNSLLFDNGTSVGVGTNTPSASYLLDVNGNVNTSGNFNQTGGGSFTSGSGLVTLNGSTSIAGVNTFSVGSGASTLGGSLGVSGLTTLSGGASISGGATVTGGATITGTTTINTSGGASTSIGSSGANFSLASSGLTVTTAGALNGITSLAASGSITAATSGTINGLSINGGALSGVASIATSGGYTQTGGGSNTFSGATTVQSTLAVQGSTLTIGNAGTTAGNLDLANGSSTNLVDLQGLNPTGSGNATIQFPSIAAGATDTVCLLTLGNCGASPSTVTTSSAGTATDLAVFTGSETIANSSITDDGTTVTVGEPLAAATIDASLIQSSGTITITPSGKLTIGATSQVLALQGNGSSTFTATSGGKTTTLGFITPTANRAINFPDEGGTVCLENSVNCGFATGGSGVTLLDTLAGTLTIADSSGTGSTITIQDASTAQKGIAEFNSSDFSASGGVIDTIQGITTSSAVTFGSLTLGSGGNLTLSATGSVNTNTISNLSGAANLMISGGANNVTFSNSSGANTFLFPTTGGTGQVICTSGITCASGGGQAVILEPGTVQTASANKTSVFINKASGTGNLIELQTGGNDAFVIDNGGNTTISNTTTITALQTNSIVPTATLSVGSTTESFSLQGDTGSTVGATDAATGFTTNLGFAVGSGLTAPTGDVTYTLENDNTVAPGSYTLCSTAGNCAGVGGGVTTSGSGAGFIPIYTSASNISDSIVSGTSTVITVGGNLAVGTAGHGQLSIGVGSSVDGTLVVNNATNGNNITIQEAAAPSANVTLKLPTSSGTFAVSASGPLSLNTTTGALSCATCLTSGGGAGGGVSSITGTDGGSVAVNGALTLNNSGTSGTTITIDNASTTQEGIAEFNATNFSASSGTINTIQDISTSSSPTFANLTVQGATGLTLGSVTNVGTLVFNDGTADGFTNTFSQATLTGASKTITVPNASGTLLVAASGNLSQSNGTVSITNSPTFTTSVTTPLLSSAASLNITPGGALTVGSTSQAVTVQGNGSTFITSTSGGFTTTVGFATPTVARSITFPDAGGNVCLSSGNCLGGGGGGANAQLSNLSSVAINTTLLPGSAAGADLGSATLPFGKLYVAGASGTPGTNNFLITGTSTSGTRTITLPDASGTVCLQTSASCGFIATGGAVTTLNSQAGAVSIADATGAGGTVTIQNASTSQEGIAEFNATDFSVTSGTVDTIQSIASGASPTFAGLTLSSALTVANGGTGAGSFTADGILYGNGTGTVQVTGAATNSILATNGTGSGVPGLTQTLPSAVQGNITTTGALTTGSIGTGFGAISTGNNITTTAALQGASLSIDGGVFSVNTSGNLTTSGTIAVTNASGVTLGVSGTTPGNLAFYNSTDSHITNLQAVAPSGNDQTVTIPASTASTDTVCLETLANCAGAGGGVTSSSGTQNYITKFSNAGATQIGNSSIYDNGSGVSVGYTGTAPVGLFNVGASNQFQVSATGAIQGVGVNSGTGQIQGTGGLSITGSSSLAATTIAGTTGITGTTTINTSGGAATTIGSGSAGAFSLQSGSASSINTGSATFAVTSSKFNVDTSGNTTLGGTLTVQGTSASSIAGELSLTLASGTGLAVTSNTTIGGTLVVTGTGASSIAGDLTLSGSGTGLAVSNNATITGTLGVGTASALQIDASGDLTTSGNATVQGATGLTLGKSGVAGNLVFDNASNSNTVTLVGTAASGTNETITIPSNGAVSADTVCLLTLANCAGAGGGVTSSSGTQNYITKFSNAGATQIGNSSIYDNGSGVSVGYTGTAPVGLFNVGASNQFQVSATGAIQGVGVNSGTGQIQGTGGLSITGSSSLAATTIAGTTGITGTTTINTSGGAATTIGSGSAGAFSLQSGSASSINTGSATFAVTSSKFNVDTSGNTTLGGTLTVQGSNITDNGNLILTSSTATITGQSVAGAGTGSSVTLEAGSSSTNNSSFPGVVTIQGGTDNTALGNSGGEVDIVGGTSTNDLGGLVTINGGAGSGQNGQVFIGNSHTQSVDIDTTTVVSGSLAVQNASGLTVGTVGSINGQLTLASSHAGGSFVLLAASTQSSAVNITIPASAGNDTVCLVTLANCTTTGGVGNFINNATSQQLSANFNIQARSSTVAATIQGAASQDILDLVTSSSTSAAAFDSAGDLTFGGSSPTISGFNAGASSSNGGTLNIQGGSSSTTNNSSVGGNVVITGGADLTPGGSFGGNVSIDAGSGFIDGNISIGITNARNITIGDNGNTLGNLTVNDDTTITQASGGGSAAPALTVKSSAGEGANASALSVVGANATSANAAGSLLSVSGGTGFGGNTGATISLVTGTGGSSSGAAGNGGTGQLSTGAGGTNSSTTAAQAGGVGGVLTVSSGNGGAETGTGSNATVGGNGGGLNITSGTGGNVTSSGGTAGSGGAITIQGGAAGTGGSVAGTVGNIILQSSGGKVGIGTASPSALLSVGTGSAFQVNSSGNITTSGTLTFSQASTIGEAVNSTGSSTGYNLTIQGGSESGATSTGGNLSLDAGTGTSTDGTVNLGTANANAINIGNINTANASNTINLIAGNSSGTGGVLVPFNTSGSNVGSTTAFQVIGNGSIPLFTVDTNGNHVTIGSTGGTNCLGPGSGKFCVNQTDSSGSSTIVNQNNSQTVSGTSSGLTADASVIELKDTSGNANILQGLIIDASNTAAATDHFNGIQVNAAGTGEAGNLLQLTSNNVAELTVTNAGATTVANGLTVQGSTGITAGVVGTTAGQLTIASAHAGGSFTIVSDTGTVQTNATTLLLPHDTNSSDTICLLTLANCAGTGGGVAATGYSNNFVTKFDATSNQITASQIFDNATFVGINTTTDSGQLSVVTGSAQSGLYVQGFTSGSNALATVENKGSTGDFLDLDNSSGAPLASFASAGNLIFGSSLTGANPSISAAANATPGGAGYTVDIQGGNETGSGTTTGGNIIIDAGTGSVTANNGTISIGTTNAKTITLGNTTGTTAVNLTSGSGGVNLAATGGPVELTGGTSSFVQIDTNGAGTINVGNTFSGAKTIAVGNTTAGTAINLTAGTTGGINLQGVTNINGSGSTAATSIGNSSAGAFSLQSGSASTINTGSATLAITSSKFNVDTSGNIQGISLDAPSSGGTLTLGPTNATGGIFADQNLTFNQSATIAASNVSSGSAHNLTILAGNDSAGASTGGSVSIDAGTGTTNGTIFLGFANASTLDIGNATSATAVNITSGVTGGINLVGTTKINTSGTEGTTLGNASAGTVVAIQGGTTGTGVTVQVGSGGTLGIGANAVAQTVNIGNSTGATAVSLQAGTGGLTIQTQGTGTLGIGNNAVAQTITIGNSTGGTSVNITAGTGHVTIQAAGTGSINIGNNAAAQTIVIGNTTGATSLSLQSGSGATAINNAGTSNTTIGNSTGTITTNGYLNLSGTLTYTSAGMFNDTSLVNDNDGSSLTLNQFGFNFSGDTVNTVGIFNVGSNSVSTNGVDIDNVANTNVSATAATVIATGISLTGTNNSNANANILDGINFTAVTPKTNNTFNGLVFGTGYNNLLQSANTNLTAAGNLSDTATSGVAASIQGASGQDIADFLANGGSTAIAVTSAGNLTFGQSSTISTTTGTLTVQAPSTLSLNSTAGGVTIGAAAGSTIQIDTASGSTGSINIGNTNTGTRFVQIGNSTNSSTTVTLFSGAYSLITTNTGVGINDSTPNADLQFGGTANRTINVAQAAASTNGSNLTIQAGAGNGSSKNGGNLVLQAAAPGSGGTAGTIQLENSAGTTALLTADTTNLIVKIGTAASNFTATGNGDLYVSGEAGISGTLLVGTATNGISTGSGALRYNGTYQNTKTIVLPAEYAGAVLDSASDAACSSANSGTMTSGYSGNSSPRQNYYNWTSAGTNQCYDVVVQVPIPADFAGWSGSPSIYVYNSTGTNSTSVYVEAIDTTNTIDTNYSGGAGCVNGGFCPISSGTTLSSASLPYSLAGTYAANGYMTLKIRLNSTSGNNVQIGNIKLTYLSSF